MYKYKEIHSLIIEEYKRREKAIDTLEERQKQLKVASKASDLDLVRSILDNNDDINPNWKDTDDVSVLLLIYMLCYI